MTPITYPPGDRLGAFKTLRLVLSGQEFDTLRYFQQASRQFGRLSYAVFGWVTFYVITDPDLIHEIFVTKSASFHKAKLFKSALGAFLGEGLLTSDGDFWRRQRKLAQPAFHARRVESYGEDMVRYAGETLDGWRDGQRVDLDREMMKLTLRIVAKTLFDADVSQDADGVGERLTVILEATNQRISAPIRLPDWIPTPQRRRVQANVAALDAILQRFIDERRASGADRGDLLSMLLAAVDDEGSGMTDRQLRDEMMTIFLAGHETTAMNLTWAWYLLSQNPTALAKLHAEVDSVLGGRAPTVADLPNLPYTEMVINEALRLYPPAPGATREPIEDVQIGGYTLPKGALLSISTYAMHRDPDLFPEPERFLPERFAPENAARMHRYAFLPFGGGPRVCIGNNFALMEARLILAAMAQRVSLTLEPGQQIVEQQTVTLRPRHGMQMRVQVRVGVGAAADARLQRPQ